MEKPEEKPDPETTVEGARENAKEEPAAGALDLEKEVEDLKKALSEAKAKAESYLSNWQRAQADFSNFRKRADQEKAEIAKFSSAIVVSSLLPVLDDFERALKHASEKLAGLTWVDGVVLIYHKLRAILQSHGLSEIETVGKEFDPRLHEAVLFGEGEEGKVIAELQKGYKFQDRIIRPAMVKVGRKEEKPAEAPQEPAQSEAPQPKDEKG